MRLLGNVGGGVEARVGVLRHQQPDEEHIDGVGPAVVVLVMEERPRKRLVMVRDERQDDHDDGDADKVPPGADVGQQGDQVDAEGIQQSVGQQNDRKENEGVDRGGRPAPRKVGEGRPGQRGAIVDRRCHRHLTQEVEPADIPGPDRLVLAGKTPGPEVQAACGRVDGTDLPHRQRHAQDKGPDKRPADRDRDRTPRVHRNAIAGDTAGQNGDDREGDGKIGEPAHSAMQFLLVAELGQPGGILVDNRDCRGNAHSSPL